MVRRRVGRPMKYGVIIQHLDDHELYTPALIAQFAQEHGYLDGDVDLKHAYQRARIAMGRFSNNHRFPDKGDGIITARGQAPTPAWYGWRWKSALR